MSDEAILAELRAIRDLLIMTGGEEMDAITEGLQEKHFKLLESLETGEWKKSGDVKPLVAEDLNISERSVGRGINDLLDKGHIEQSGSARATKYRKTSTGLVIERANQL